MKLWIESARQGLGGVISSAIDGVMDGTPASAISTLTTEEGFVGLVVDGSLGPEIETRARSMVNPGPIRDGVRARPWSSTDVDDLLAAVFACWGESQGAFAFLQVQGGDRARLVECDAPPLFMARQGRLVLLPVIEEELRGHLVRTCEFDLRDGDHLAMVSAGYLRGIRAGNPTRSGGWRDVSAAVRRLTETRCSAEQLAAALIRQYERQVTRDQGPGTGEGPSAMLAPALEQSASASVNHRLSAISHPPSAVVVLAMFVRPMRTVTVWSGPPADRSAERPMLDALMAEEDVRVVCGDTTAEIAARMLGAKLVMEPPPQEGWAEVPPVSRMVLPDGSEPVAMVTEGVVTMRAARERVAEAAHRNGGSAVRARNLLGRADGASRLAYVLLMADKVRFLAGLAVNPAQVSADGSPLRRKAVEELTADLKALGKLVSVETY
jgi:hypothetical protein